MQLDGLVHPDGATADFGLIWFAVFANANPNVAAAAGDYQDSGDLAGRSGWRNMLFTERNYRALVRARSGAAEGLGSHA